MVTPSSKIVGDLAQFMVQNKLTKEQIVERAEDLSFPKSVIEYFQGLVGMPYGGFPEPLRTRVLKGKESLRKRAGEDLPPLDYTKLKMELFEKHGREFSEKDVMSASLYPKVFDTFEQFRKTYGPVDKLGTRVFFVGPKIAEEFPVRLVFFYHYSSHRDFKYQYHYAPFIFDGRYTAASSYKV
ncbi:unnamed protein product [Protopolystoma xenopodis]|uniref:Carboxylase conserved domain-containing protein n=1 Tax=Protopolystoma xenopodis TaxID=117903 RepID=A0A3S4ZXC6_9PLAT|nr:unnamed protein product [Protopolystoma xenopodis]